MTAKSLDSQNVWGVGAGQSTIPIQVKISCLKKIKQYLHYLFTVILLSGQP